MMLVAFIVGGLASWGAGRLASSEKGRREAERGTGAGRGAVLTATADIESIRALAGLGDAAGCRPTITVDELRDAFDDADQTRAPDDLYLSGASAIDREIDELISRQLGRGKAVCFAPAPQDLSLFRWRLRQSPSGMPLLTVQAGGFSPAAARLKRWVDIVGALLLIAFASPLLLLLAAGLWALYGGPVLFRQERSGRAGKSFKVLKFRTMRRDAEEILAREPALYRRYVANNFKLPLNEDVRITPVGKFLRASSLDELPQLFNVLRGEMSLVGPRPVVPAEVVKFGVYAPLILSIRPGLTGLWQVKGRSLIGDYDERVRLNIEYLRDASNWRDFVIMAKTVLVVLRLKDAGWQRASGEPGAVETAAPKIKRDEILFD